VDRHGKKLWCRILGQRGIEQQHEAFVSCWNVSSRPMIYRETLHRKLDLYRFKLNQPRFKLERPRFKFDRPCSKLELTRLKTTIRHLKFKTPHFAFVTIRSMQRIRHFDQHQSRKKISRTNILLAMTRKLLALTTLLRVTVLDKRTFCLAQEMPSVFFNILR